MKTSWLLIALAVLLALVQLIEYAVLGIIIILGVLVWRLRKYIIKAFE